MFAGLNAGRSGEGSDDADDMFVACKGFGSHVLGCQCMIEKRIHILLPGVLLRTASPGTCRTI